MIKQHCLKSGMTFYSFLKSVGSGAPPAAPRKTLVSWVKAGDSCIPLYIVMTYDKTLIVTMCMSP